MNKLLKIAIYSGQISSTTFIERLIEGLASKKQNVLLFGIKKRAISYSNSVSVIGYKTNRFSKSFSFFKYSFLLLLFKHKEKRILDALLHAQNRNNLNEKLKSYPVLYHQPDVFHVQWAKGLDDWMWVQEFGMKLVLSLRGAHINYSPIADLELAAIYRQNFPKVDGFHAVSAAISIEAGNYGANKKTIQVVKSGLNLEEFVFDLKKFDNKTPLTIISVGRDHWIKNYRLALDAMLILKQKAIPFHYSIIGIAENESLIFQCAQLGLEREVSFIDFLPIKEVKEAIKQADILFLPSLKEGIANVVLEAMALGTLVVSTNCGGMAEVVIPNQTGYLVPVRDVNAMAMALAEVSKLSLEDYQKMTKRARGFIEQYHTEDLMVVGMQEMYERLSLRG